MCVPATVGEKDVTVFVVNFTESQAIALSAKS